MTQSRERDEILVPRTLEECFVMLNDIDGVNAWLNMSEQDAMVEAHWSIGRWIRNNWGLWSGGDLADYFNGLGIKHPDDMSSIILVSFHRNMNGRDIDLDGQVEYYKAYWKKYNE